MTGILIIVGMAIALVIGIWVGIGLPGIKGLRSDRVVEAGRAKRLRKQHIDLLKTRR
jgi:hypothetical protein